jgi:RNA polymerase sigma-70 factor (ECF subfamily)
LPEDRLTRLRLISPTDPEAPAEPLPAAAAPVRPGAEPGVPVDIDELFQLYAADVAARGLSMLGNPDEADDLVQDVFLRAFRALGSLAEPRLARPWLMAIAVREALRRLKKRRLSRLWLAGADFDFEQLAAPTAAPDVKLQVGRLFRALDALSPELRIAWVLRYLEAETTEAVAEQCGWSLSTTKRRIAAAQQTLSKRIGS